MITISAFKWVPDFARGQVRDLRVRWALEEAGLPYETRLLEQGDHNKPEYRVAALRPRRTDAPPGQVAGEPVHPTRISANGGEAGSVR